MFMLYLRAIRAGRCREWRCADHIFIQIYFRVHADNRKCRFQMAAILKSYTADIKREFRVAQYLKMFDTC